MAFHPSHQISPSSGQGAVGENRILFNRFHGHRVGFIGSTGCHAEEPASALIARRRPSGANFHPGNIVTDAFGFPAGIVGCIMAKLVLPQATGRRR